MLAFTLRCSLLVRHGRDDGNGARCAYVQHRDSCVAGNGCGSLCVVLPRPGQLSGFCAFIKVSRGEWIVSESQVS